MNFGSVRSDCVKLFFGGGRGGLYSRLIAYSNISPPPRVQNGGRINGTLRYIYIYLHVLSRFNIKINALPSHTAEFFISIFVYNNFAYKHGYCSVYMHIYIYIYITRLKSRFNIKINALPSNTAEFFISIFVYNNFAYKHGYPFSLLT